MTPTIQKCKLDNMKFKTPQARKEYIQMCVKQGMSYQKIANKLGISRQRVHQLFRYRIMYIDI